MSTQPSPGGRLSLEFSGESDDLVFGDHPQSSLAIPKALMSQLCARVNEGAQSLSHGGVEVGGLLVGPKVRGGRVVVDAIIPLPIEYRFGPLFKMSVFDLPNIAPAIEAVLDDLSKTVVGFYRSRTCDEKTVRESDHEIFEAIEASHPSFAGDFRSCVILAPKSESVALACVAMRSGKAWEEMQPFELRLNPPSIIPFSPSTSLLQLTRNLRAEEQATNLPVPVAPPQPVAKHRATQNPAVVESRSANPAEAGRPAIGRARIWVYAIAGVLTLLVAGAYLFGDRQPPEPFPTPPAQQASVPRFGFSATFESPVWRLSWNRAAMDDLKPLGGVLTIQDGILNQELPLAPSDLASGTIFYTPQNADLNFGLRVDLGGTFAEEHVRVLGAPGGPQKPAVPQQSVPGKSPLQPPRIESSAVVPPAPNKQITAPVTSAVPPPAPAAPAKPDPIVAFAPSVQSKETAKAPAPEREIISAPAPVVQPTFAALAIPVPPTFEPPRPVPAAAPATQPVTQPAATPPASNATPPKSEPAATANVPTPTAAVPNPAAAASAKQNYVGPRPVMQESLQAPSNMPSGVNQVQVNVEIDARGKVTKVTPIGWTGTNAPLMVRAVRAASGWVFAPAQLNGQAVPSQMVLTFRVNEAPAR